MKINNLSATFIFFFIFSLLGTFSINAQQRVKISDGVYIVTYGNVSVIENDNTQQTIQIKVEKKDDGLYDVLCGNTVVKQVAKSGIRAGIGYAIQTYTSIPKWVTDPIVRHIVDKVYDGVCEYYK